MPEKSKPFHESIVDALYQAPRAYVSCLGRLILNTKIPKNHDVILGAWKTASADCNFTNELRTVPDHILEQKAHAEAAGTIVADAPMGIAESIGTLHIMGCRS